MWEKNFHKNYHYIRFRVPCIVEPCDHSDSEKGNPLVKLFLTHPCRRQPLKISFISNDRRRSLFEALDWLFICDDPNDVRDLT